MQLTVKQIFDMIDNGQLHYDQTTQREFLYNKEFIKTDDGDMTRAGALIRAILKLHIQLPALYFWKNEDGTYNVHDGKQRILSLYTAFYPQKNNDDYVSTNLGDGKLTCPKLLSEEEKNKLLNYTFDIVVRKGSKKEEEISFYEINTHSVNLTEYECLKGMFYGKFISSFENIINQNRKLCDCLREIGRGEQANQILKVLLLKENEVDKPNAKDLLRNEIGKIYRDLEFDAEKFHIKTLFEITDQLQMSFPKINFFMTFRVAKYIDDQNTLTNWNIETIMNAFIKISKEANDVSKWKIGTFKTFIKNAILEKRILCGVRFFNDDNLKPRLFSQNPCCNHPNCKENRFKKLELDHKIPWSKGGTTTEDNVQLMCKSHNSSKGNDEDNL